MAQRMVKPPRGGKRSFGCGLPAWIGEGREFLVSGELGTVHGIPGFVDLGSDGKSWLPDQSRAAGAPAGRCTRRLRVHRALEAHADGAPESRARAAPGGVPPAVPGGSDCRHRPSRTFISG